MTLNLCVLTPNRTIWDSEVDEIILPTNTGQIGVLTNHACVAKSRTLITFVGNENNENIVKKMTNMHICNSI